MQQFERELQYGCSSDGGKVMGNSTESSSSAVMQGSRPNISTETDTRDQSRILGCWGSIGCALAPKLYGGARVYKISNTQKASEEIPSGLRDI